MSSITEHLVMEDMLYNLCLFIIIVFDDETVFLCLQ